MSWGGCDGRRRVSHRQVVIGGCPVVGAGVFQYFLYALNAFRVLLIRGAHAPSPLRASTPRAPLPAISSTKSST
ncbi:conserved hypothetical protein [Streptomyces sviceus ATCC 29083]|uniref:Uncharacterized protein n=1 Tax=Streptomyces sviceus (strain ATCC 29083 / DSM 924 / JCM 4929 / NBRC 13980 / NCIMB 11184 / NRRL 5439 / UC 5370) TaxID=463191 RepID=B5HUY3_STRX2|nr:conserved hypothetical protein [Streptomyces sviceus ATCC 29083]